MLPLQIAVSPALSNRVDSVLVKAVHRASGAVVSGVVFKGISAEDRVAKRAAEAANK